MRETESSRLEDGPVIQRSLGKTWLGLAVGAFLLFCSLLIVFAGGVGFYAAAQQPAGATGAIVGYLALGGVVLVCGLVLMVCFGILTWRQLARQLNNERYIIGKTKLQWVMRDDELLGEIPYDNIRNIRLKAGKTGHGSKLYTIAIWFIDPDREDTFIRGVGQAGENCDYVISDWYEVDLPDFHKQLSKAWKKARAGQPGPDEDHD